jgi:thymidine kinase
MLGETEEYEPLSRAAYYHAMRKDQEENRNPLLPKERRLNASSS